MPLTLQLPTTPAQPQALKSQRPQLKMVWHKEWDGKRERLVAHWVVSE